MILPIFLLLSFFLPSFLPCFCISFSLLFVCLFEDRVSLCLPAALDLALQNSLTLNSEIHLPLLSKVLLLNVCTTTDRADTTYLYLDFSLGQQLTNNDMEIYY